jgi:hypothetical protein
VTLKVGEGQPKDFKQRSIGKRTLLANYIKFRSVVHPESLNKVIKLQPGAYIIPPTHDMHKLIIHYIL